MWTYHARLYVKGAISASVNGAVNALTLIVVDKSDFNVWSPEGWKNLAAVALVSSIVGFLIYMKQHPLPDPLKDSDYLDVKRDQMAELKGTEHKV